MTINEFLQELLASQELKPEQKTALQDHKKEVTDFLRAEYGNDPVIKYAGSYIKGTLNSEHYDLDIVCYFPSSEDRTLKEIHNDVLDRLEQKYQIEPKASAVRITNAKGADADSDYHIDVVPGRFIKDSKDVFLHVVDGDKERMQTNLKTHIDYITGSGCVDVIRLVKLWAYRNDLDVKTFVLELFTVNALSGFRKKSDLRAAFLKALEVFKDEFETKELVDPANAANIVSQLVHSSLAKKTARVAGESIEQIAESDNPEDWKIIFHEGSSRGLSSGQSLRPLRTKINRPPGQWAQ